MLFWYAPLMCNPEANLKPGQYSSPGFNSQLIGCVDSGWFHTLASWETIQDFMHRFKNSFLQLPSLCDPPIPNTHSVASARYLLSAGQEWLTDLPLTQSRVGVGGRVWELRWRWRSNTSVVFQVSTGQIWLINRVSFFGKSFKYFVRIIYWYLILFDAVLILPNIFKK